MGLLPRITPKPFTAVAPPPLASAEPDPKAKPQDYATGNSYNISKPNESHSA